MISLSYRSSSWSRNTTLRDGRMSFVRSQLLHHIAAPSCVFSLPTITRMTVVSALWNVRNKMQTVLACLWSSSTSPRTSVMSSSALSSSTSKLDRSCQDGTRWER